MDMVPVESSCVAAVGYDATWRELHVTFRSGRHYVYQDVPASVYEDFLSADSKGTFFNAAVKDCYSWY